MGAGVFELARSLRHNRQLVRDFVVRDLKGRYVGSSMGFFWSVINPLISLATYSFVFRYVLKTRWSDQQPDAQVVMMMFLGIVVWNSYAEVISRATSTLVENSNLIQKVVFPSEILPSYLAISSLVNMCIGLLFVLGGVLWLGYLDPIPFPEAIPGRVVPPGDPVFMPFVFGAPLVLLPLLFALQSALALGFGYLLAALNLFVRDVGHLIGVFLTVWMFATPIFYPAVMVRKQGFGWVLDINPMCWLIDAYRDVMLFGVWPDFALLGRFALIAGVALFIGTRFFFRTKRSFPDLL